ncbi:leucine zipper domain-containing protein [Pseudonocardia halophobica]|uniref:leucine zipper domain-containing protein n=1 Tax=Pseudonocardia halophobica TaxID=29401 RepID=UPI0009DE9DFA
MGHRNARTTVHGRRLIIEHWQGGWPAAQIAEQLVISRATVHKWINRFRAEGWSGLEDRPSRPHRSPTRTPRRWKPRSSSCAPVPGAGQCSWPGSSGWSPPPSAACCAPRCGAVGRHRPDHR